MRIFQIIESSTNTSLPVNKTWYRNLYEPLVELGHDVYLFPANEGRLVMGDGNEVRRAFFTQKVLNIFINEHRKRPFTLFFAYLMDGMVDPSLIDEIKALGVVTCNFSCNNAHQFYLVSELSPHFDYNLHSEKFVRDKFLNVGANPLWWPMASNPKYFKPVDVPRNIEASFVGANYAKRASYLKSLLDNGISTQIFGPGWSIEESVVRRFLKRSKLIAKSVIAPDAEHQYLASLHLADYDFKNSFYNRYRENLHGPISDEYLIELYSRSHVSLGFLEVFDNHDPSKQVIQHLHLREFEAPMCGALYFTGYTEELSEMFEPDIEVVVYRSEHELLDKVRYYLAHDKDAEMIRKRGRQRALAHHTYQNRFKELFEFIGLS